MAQQAHVKVEIECNKEHSKRQVILMGFSGTDFVRREIHLSWGLVPLPAEH